MRINILAFGIVKEIFGGGSRSIELPEHATTGDLKDKLGIQFPQLKKLTSCLVAVNDEYAEDDQALHPEDEVAVIPPVSGG